MEDGEEKGDILAVKTSLIYKSEVITTFKFFIALIAEHAGPLKR
jgi:hypothetical protein